MITDTDDRDVAIVVANLHMELSIFMREGIPWPKEGKLHDIQIAARVLNRGVGMNELIGLGPLQESVLGRDGASWKIMDDWIRAHRMKSGRDIWRTPVPMAGFYCQDDARDTQLIMEKWIPEVGRPAPTRWWWNRAPIAKSRHDLYEMEMEAGIKALQSAIRGSRIDRYLVRRRAHGAEILQTAVGRWLQDKLSPTLNPGSATQVRGILFGALGFKPSTTHTTDSFKKLPEAKQAKIVSGLDEPLSKYASLDVDALEYYASEYPEHSELMFMLAVYRKCTTAINWFRDRIEKFATMGAEDPWWSPSDSLVDLIYHRLKTVGTVSGRMSAADFNFQQVPKRIKMLIVAQRLFNILTAFLPSSQLNELRDALDIATAKDGDEAKTFKVEPGDPLIDFSVRAMFIPRSGFVIRDFDLSQVEMRGFAHFSGNKLLCSGYGTPMSSDDVVRSLDAVQEAMVTGHLPMTINRRYHYDLEDNPFDIHSFVGKEVDITRKDAKGINFGILYGMGKRKLARERGWPPDKAAVYLRRYHGKFYEIEELQDMIKAALRRRGYIFDPFGRRYYLPMSKSYIGLNRLIQGWAASVFKLGFVRIVAMMESPHFGASGVDPITRRPMMDGSKILSCIHDEHLMEVLRELNTPMFDWCVRTNMTAVHGLKVPLGTSSEESDGSWDAAEDYRREAA